MISFAVAFALLLHVVWWGAGLAMAIMPGRWRRFWPVLVMPAGFALQSVVVWLGCYADLAGTNRYAWPSEVIPAALLAAGLARIGGRRAWVDFGRFGVVWMASAGALLLLVLPLAIASRGLTSVSLGSCDAADYAAGARVFMEFAHSDRSGFLGLTDVVRVMSADNFYDFWLRLNHFTPSALMALNGSILHCAPHELASLVTMVIVAATMPVVFWVSRAVFGYSGAASLTIAGVFGISPIPWYSVAQVSPAPLLAANAIALLSWAGFALWNGRLTWTRGMAFAGVLGVGYALVLGSYNFILLVSLVPVVAYVGTWTILTNRWMRAARWLLVMLVPLAGVGVVFWDRVAGLIERFMLFQTYDFGWRIPVLTPEGWVGLVAGGTLHAWSWLGLRWILALVLGAAWVWAFVGAMRKGRRRVWLVASITVPVLIGYAFLEVRGIVRGTNASYDAFKLFTVFYPLLLPAFCWWITLRWGARLTAWLVVGVLAGVVIAGNLVACAMFVVQLSRPPLIVDGELRQLRRVEALPDVASVNVLLPDMWSRLWANVFLLRKPQYFATHTYEGRLNTMLRGEWDLVGDVVRTEAGAEVTRQITSHYRLVDARSPAFVRVMPGDGWHAEERLPDGERWRWTRGDATLRIENPQVRAVTARLLLDGRGAQPREVELVSSDGARSARVHVGADRAKVALPPVTLPPGRSTLTLHSDLPASSAGDDSRPLGLCVFTLVVDTAAERASN